MITHTRILASSIDRLRPNATQTPLNSLQTSWIPPLSFHKWQRGEFENAVKMDPEEDGSSLQLLLVEGGSASQSQLVTGLLPSCYPPVTLLLPSCYPPVTGGG